MKLLGLTWGKQFPDANDLRSYVGHSNMDPKKQDKLIKILHKLEEEYIDSDVINNILDEIDELDI